MNSFYLELLNSVDMGRILKDDIRVADRIVMLLESVGVEYIFGMSASNNIPLFDALCDSNIKVIFPKNEAGATYSASHYAEASNNIGVCFLAGTVGVNNAINGIGDAFVNKYPMLIVSGAPNLKSIRKGAIQNVDNVSITEAITKYSYQIKTEEEALDTIINAIDVATKPPYGPVHISIPVDIQSSKKTINFIKTEKSITIDYDDMALNNAIDVINKKRRGLIFIGKGAKNFSMMIKELSEKLNWPIISTPRGKGIIEDEFRLNIGNHGMFSPDFTKQFVNEYKPDCLLIMGTSLKEVTLPSLDDEIMQCETIIHIDFDRLELNRIIQPTISVYYDLEYAIPKIIKKSVQKKHLVVKKNKLSLSETTHESKISIKLFIENIGDIIGEKCYIVSDIGEFMTYILKYMQSRKDMRFDISTNYGAMGNAVAGCIGTHLACPSHRTVVIAGDGGFFMNATEVLTARENGLPIVYIVINNSMLGFVRNGQKGQYGRFNPETEYSRVYVSKMFENIGIGTMIVQENGDFKKIIDFVNNSAGPCVIEIISDNSERSPINERVNMLKTIL